jgi:hypothetical protein
MLLLVEDDTDTLRTVSLVVHSLDRNETLYSCKLPIDIFNKQVYGAGFSTKPESRFADYRHMSPSTMFKTDPALMTICVSFRLAGDPEYICIVLAVRPFLKMCKNLRRDHPNRNQFEWEEWGPSVTSWLPCPAINVPGYRCTSGPRILMSGDLSKIFHGLEVQLGLVLLDFNPRPIKRGGGTQQNQNTAFAMFDKGLDWKSNQNAAIKTTLPFRAFGEWALRQDYNNFHFEGNTIICRMVST